MSFTGTVENGAIKLPPDVHLPDGTKVEIVLATSSKGRGVPPTLLETLKDIVGKAEGLPEDFAAEHDHYIHGTSRRSES